MKRENKTNKELIDDVIRANTIDYNYAKLAEECTELTDVLIKMITKPNRREERMQHLIEEMGDVQLRLDILKRALLFGVAVQTRYDDKLEYLSKKVEEGKYENY